MFSYTYEMLIKGKGVSSQTYEFYVTLQQRLYHRFYTYIYSMDRQAINTDNVAPKLRIPKELD